MNETSASTFEAIALWSQVAGAVVFLIVLVLLFRKYMIPAVQANERARNAEIAAAEARLARIRTETETARGEITRAGSEAAEIRARATDVERRERERLLADAQAEGERVVRNAEGELDRARLAARDRLRIELIEKALLKARADASARVDARTDSGLISATVDDLARGQG